MFYDRFEELRTNKGVSRQKACIDCGFSRTAWNKWRDGAVPNGDGLQRLADYFGITVDYLLGNETELQRSLLNSPDPRDSEHEIEEEELKVAYFRGADPTLTKEDIDEMWEDAKNFRDFIVQKKKREKYGK